MAWKTNKKTQQKPIIAAPKANPAARQTFLEHVYELRARLFWVIASLLVMSSIGFAFKDYLVGFILAPLQGEKLVYLTIGGGFSFIFTVCLYFGAIITVPVAIYHLYRFLQPLLPRTSRRFTVTVLVASSLLALAGAAFGYFVAIRASINFLMGFASGAISPSVTTESYLNFIIIYTAGLAVIFQLPLIMFLFDRIRTFPPGSLLSSQRFVITGATIVAALITPTPDAINMMIIAVPIITIYEIGIALLFVSHRMSAKKAQLRPAKNSAVTPRSVSSVLPKSAQLEPVKNIQLVASVTKPPRRSIDGIRTSPRQAIIVPDRPISTPTPSKRLSIDGISVI